MPELHVVAGPNGVGKTTLFKTIVPTQLDYLNADLIAKTIKDQAGGLNAQDIANGEAGKIFLEKSNRLESFAIETNLYDVETYKAFLGLQAKGYRFASISCVLMMWKFVSIGLNYAWPSTAIMSTPMLSVPDT